MSETAAGVAHVQDVVDEVMVAHAARGATLQTWLRLGVVAFVWACLLLVPPSQYAGWCYAVAVAYPVLWAAWLVWDRRGRVTTADWGWVLLVLGAVLIACGMGVLSGNVAARAVGVLLAGLNAVVALVFIEAAPGWGVIVILVDVVVIYALTVHGREMHHAL